MNYLYGTDTIIHCYNEFTGNDIESTRDIRRCLFIAYGLYARKTGKKMFDIDFQQWADSPEICVNGAIVDIPYEIFAFGHVYLYSSGEHILTNGVELDCIKKAVEIFAKNTQTIRHLLSEDSKFLTCNCKMNVNKKIAFDSICKLFKDDNNIKILTGEKLFVEPTTEIEK